MIFYLFFLSSRLFLSNKVVTNLTLNNKLSKKVEGSWYYVKCQKNRNCSDIIHEIKRSYNISDISIISKNAFTIYFTSDESKILNILNLKYIKIPKDDKIIKPQNNTIKYTNKYIVFLSKQCQIPYSTIQVSSNYIIFQSNETFSTISTKLSKIGCVRLFEQLPHPRLNSRPSIQESKGKRKKIESIDSNQQTITTINPYSDDSFMIYNNFKDENDSDGNLNFDLTRKMAESAVYSIFSSTTHQNLQKHGINGKDQIVSIVDTGVDSSLCWFVDPEREVEFGKESPSEHRKIQSYFTYADDKDLSPSGHGSFVAGLIGGSALCDLYYNDKCPGAYFNGIAPNSRLVINDVFYLKKETSQHESRMYKRILEKEKNDKNKDKDKVIEEDEENEFDEDKYNAKVLSKKETKENKNEKNKEEIEFKTKTRNERKMKSKFKKNQHGENVIAANDESDNEIIYYNPYDNINQDQIVASFPENLSKLFLIPSKLLGATVQYHGFDFRDKSLFTSLIDMLAYENPQITFVFPAGDKINSQRIGKKTLNEIATSGIEKSVDFSFDKSFWTTSKVSSPGDSKNVLTVGATYIDPIISLNEFRMLSSTSPIIVVCNNVEYIGYCDEFYGISFFEYILNSFNLNQDLFNNSYSFNVGSNAFVETEKLDAYTFIQSPQFESTEILILFSSNALSNKINKPIIRLPDECQKSFLNVNTIQIKFFNDLQSLHLLKSFKKFNHAKYSLENPVYLRRKPDIYMPGGPVYGPNSGSGSSSCGVNGVRMGEGTSVAAALATGEILLIQQYIEEGFYLNKKGAINITSHMIRAILSNIAIVENDEGEKLTLTENKRIPNLNKFCIFRDNYNMNEIGGIRFFSDSLTSNSFHVYKFKAQFNGNLKVTLAWNDPPHDPFAPSDVLFKLDCRIESVKDGKMFGDVHYDPLNTVKNYLLKNLQKDEEYKIYIVCGDLLFFEKVNYTIVVSGPFDHFSAENDYIGRIEIDKKDNVKCLHECKDKSKCVNGYCQCAKKKYGEDCSKDMIEMHNHQTLSNILLLPHDSAYMSYVFKQWKPGSKLSFTFSIERANPDSKGNFGQKKKNDNSIKVNEFHHIDNNDLTKKLFFMFSINKVPTWQTANCDSENCQWISIKGNSLVIEYHLWNFVRNGDTLYFVAYSRENYPISFSVSSSELYT